MPRGNGVSFAEEEMWGSGRLLYPGLDLSLGCSCHTPAFLTCSLSGFSFPSWRLAVCPLHLWAQAAVFSSDRCSVRGWEAGASSLQCTVSRVTTGSSCVRTAPRLLKQCSFTLHLRTLCKVLIYIFSILFLCFHVENLVFLVTVR